MQSGKNASEIENQYPMCYTPDGKPGNPLEHFSLTESLRCADVMDILLARMALVLVVALVVGGATYVVLSIIEIVQKK